MSEIAAELAIRLEDFAERFYQDDAPPVSREMRKGSHPCRAYEDPRLVWEVTNLQKPESQRHSTIVQGAVIDRFVLNGFYDIKLIGKVGSPEVEARIASDLKREQANPARKDLHAGAPVSNTPGTPAAPRVPVKPGT